MLVVATQAAPVALNIDPLRLERTLSHLRHLTLRVVQNFDNLGKNYVPWMIHCLSLIPPSNTLETVQLHCQVQPGFVQKHHAPAWQDLDLLLTQVSTFGKLNKVLISIVHNPELVLDVTRAQNRVASALRLNLQHLEAKGILCITNCLIEPANTASRTVTYSNIQLINDPL